jgi:hypothetical protein
VKKNPVENVAKTGYTQGNQSAPALRDTSLGRFPGSPTEVRTVSEPSPTVSTVSTSSPRIRLIRESAWRAIEANDAVTLYRLLVEHRRVTLRAIDDHHREKQVLAKHNVARDARDLATEQCEVEYRNDPKSAGDFEDGSGDYIVIPVDDYSK